MVTGTLVDLRPLQEADLDHLERVANDAGYHGPFGTFVLKGAGDIRRRFEVDGLLSREHGRLVVVDKSGATVGGVSYHAVSYGPPPSSLSYNIGVVIDSVSRRRGYGADAQSLLARYLFDTYTVERVEASTDVENTGEQRALERAGFTREGILRHAQWRAGAWHDLVLYSKLRGE
jgi:RimJ/RimL family protein N-acetyltransferase